jgi:hypothetical protein
MTTRSVTVRWRSAVREVGVVRYGTRRLYLEDAIRENDPTRDHRIVVNELQPGTKYFYRVESPSLQIDNSDRWFETLRDASDPRPMWVWVIGDSGEPGPGQSAVTEQMHRWIQKRPDISHPDLWLLLGDNAYNWGSQAGYDDSLFGAYPELVKHHVPWAVYGNHDAESWAFFRIFDFPTDGSSGGVPSGDEHYYAINSGNLHIVMLDSQSLYPSPNRMEQWLEEDLSANTRQWTIACFHHPPYSDGTHSSDGWLWENRKMQFMRRNIVPILEKHDVDLVLSGHSHDYERSELIHNHYGPSTTFDPDRNIVQGGGGSYTKPSEKGPGNGTIYMVMGSSSKVTPPARGGPLRLKHPAMPYSYPLMGSVMLEITPDALRSWFITSEGDVKDIFVIHKEPPPVE